MSAAATSGSTPQPHGIPQRRRWACAAAQRRSGAAPACPPRGRPATAAAASSRTKARCALSSASSLSTSHISTWSSARTPAAARSSRPTRQRETTASTPRARALCRSANVPRSTLGVVRVGDRALLLVAGAHRVDLRPAATGGRAPACGRDAEADEVARPQARPSVDAGAATGRGRRTRRNGRRAARRRWPPRCRCRRLPAPRPSGRAGGGGASRRGGRWT